MTVELLGLSQATFDRLVGSGFRVLVDEDRAVSVKLVECRALPHVSRREVLAIRAEPFSLLFEGPGDLVLEQQIYRLEHPDLGELDLFLVTVGPGKIEAVFN